MYFLTSRRSRWYRCGAGHRRRVRHQVLIYRACRATFIHNRRCTLCMSPGGRLNLHHRGRIEDCRHALLCNPCHRVVSKVTDFPPRGRATRSICGRARVGVDFRYCTIRSLARIVSRRYSLRGCSNPHLAPVAHRFLAIARGDRALTPVETRALRHYDPISHTEQFLAALRSPVMKGGKRACHRSKTQA